MVGLSFNSSICLYPSRIKHSSFYIRFVYSLPVEIRTVHLPTELITEVVLSSKRLLFVDRNRSIRGRGVSAMILLYSNSTSIFFLT